MIQLAHDLKNVLPLIVSAAAVNWLVSTGQALAGSGKKQFDLLAPLMELRAGQTVAEIGAGNGRLSVLAAQSVGPSGRVFSTEIDDRHLRKIRSAVNGSGLENIEVRKAKPDDTALPIGCCDVIFMVGVYHHITDPGGTDASVFRALKPGGKLVVADFRPYWLLKPFTPDGIPANRGGHGIPPEILKEELTAAGLQQTRFLDNYPPSWFGSNFTAVFQKPLDGSR